MAFDAALTPTSVPPLRYDNCSQAIRAGGFSVNTHRTLSGRGKVMRFKVFAAVAAALGLMVAEMGAATATNGSSHAITAQTPTTTRTAATAVEPVTSLVGDD